VSAAPGPGIAISVVVCTRDRPSTLGPALDSLLAQDHPAGEVVVIDQSDGGETEAMVRERARIHPNLVYRRTPARGLSRARNAGVRASRGAITAFTDDDCVAPRSWLSSIVAAFESCPQADVLYGQVVVPESLGKREGVDGVTPMLLFGRREVLNPPRGFRVFGMGANCAFRRSAFDRVGGYDTALGAGGLLRGGEDFDFSFRVFRTGGAILLEPSIAVEHHGFRPGSEWPETVRGYGIGVGSFYFKHVRAGDLLATWMLGKMLLRETGGVLRKLVLRRPRGSQWTYVVHVLKGVRMSLDLRIQHGQRLYVVPGEGP